MNAQALNQLEKKFGTAVEFDGKKYWLTQDAYLTGQLEAPYYEAAAINKAGARYMVYWDILPEINIHYIEDEHECCDWDNPTDFKKI